MKTEIAYAGLVALLVRVVAERDPALLGGGAIADPMKGALADAGEKRALVQRILHRHGPGLLLSVGQHLHLADETPALTVLLTSPNPRVLAEKFMRLEGYHHSAHRTAIRTGPGGWECTRSSKGSPPGEGENCLIAGLLLGLLMAIGLAECRLEIGGRSFAPSALEGATLPPGAATEFFRIGWTPRAETAGQGAPAGAEAQGGRVSDRLAALFAGDLGRSWKIADAARLLALSQRSLQRQLQDERRSYSGVLRRARMQAATLALVTTDTSLAEIGYCCGYADQAHFQRDFRLTANTTPRRFRRLNAESEQRALPSRL